MGVALVDGGVLPVDIAGYQHDAVESVLRAVRLGLNQHHLFRDRVGCALFLWNALPYLGFVNRRRRVRRVGASSNKRDEPPDPGLVAGVERVRVDQYIFPEELRRVISIRDDASNFGGEMKDRVRLNLVQHARGSILLQQVEVRTAHGDNFAPGFLL